MRKVVAVFLLSLVSIFILIFFVFPKTGFAVNEIDSNYLESLRQRAEVECLQNSQCPVDKECLGNVCVTNDKINFCQNVKLYTGTRKLEIGQPINSVKTILTKIQLPYLLSDGEFVEIVENKPIEYFYISTLLIGENKIEKENNYYLIKNDKPLYTYRLVFSNAVDFSNKNIQGQTLRILGEEYIIGSNSDNSNLYLISEKKNVKIENNDNIQLIKNEDGKILEIKIEFFSLDRLKTSNSNTDSIFNSVKFSFKSANEKFIDVNIGGSC